MLDTHLHMILIQRALGAYTEDRLHNSHNTQIKIKIKIKMKPHILFWEFCAFCAWFSDRIYPPPYCSDLSYRQVGKKGLNSSTRSRFDIIHICTPTFICICIGGCWNPKHMLPLSYSKFLMPSKKLHALWGFEFTHTLMHVTQACTCESWLHSSSKDVF